MLERLKKISYLGVISYGLYMFHGWPLKLIRDVLDKFGYAYDNVFMTLLIAVVAFVLTIVISHFSYIYFEYFFIKLKSKYS